MEQARYWMWPRTKYNSSNNSSSSRFLVGYPTAAAAAAESTWEEKAFAEDAAGRYLGGCVWPPRSYSCSFCQREFRSAQALGGHMNVHRRDRARLRQLSSSGLDGEAAAGAVNHRVVDKAACRPPQVNPNSCILASPVSPRVSAHTLFSTTRQNLKEPLVRSATRFVEDSTHPLRRQVVPQLVNFGGSVNGTSWLRSWRDQGAYVEEISCNKRRRTCEHQQVQLEELNHNKELDLELRLGNSPN
ncbi:hypothetical protein Cni_G02493 [Canna indica]|uniref:C2H2-type domain-containing protein n=1 Tax=Canna indica TaxID=4628 RepID=A0AAQ3JQ57_9LILI|nr:hypothetical protein Cni_G02493 [Canna indica]